MLDSIAATYTEYDVRQQVDTIRRLNSVDLEVLYNMTRYPNWSKFQISLNWMNHSDQKVRAWLRLRGARLS